MTLLLEQDSKVLVSGVNYINLYAQEGTTASSWQTNLILKPFGLTKLESKISWQKCRGHHVFLIIDYRERVFVRLYRCWLIVSILGFNQKGRIFYLSKSGFFRFL